MLVWRDIWKGGLLDGFFKLLFISRKFKSDFFFDPICDIEPNYGQILRIMLLLFEFRRWHFWKAVLLRFFGNNVLKYFEKCLIRLCGQALTRWFCLNDCVLRFIVLTRGQVDDLHSWRHLLKPFFVKLIFDRQLLSHGLTNIDPNNLTGLSF